MSNPTKRNPELEAAIERDPDNIESYLVYGDWLLAQGDPRGELIALQCAAHQAPPEKAREFQRSAHALLDKHEDLLLGGLVGLKHKVKWRFGFIDELTMSGGLSKAITHQSGRELKHDEFLRLFLALPSARFLRCLSMELAATALPPYRQFLAALEEGVHPTLETISLGCEEDFNREIRRLGNLGNIRLSNDSFPRLRSLTLYGWVDRLDGLNLPELRQLTIFSGHDLNDVAGHLLTARLTKLERLVLRFPWDYLGSWTGYGDGLPPLIDALEVLPLKHLGLHQLLDDFPDRARGLLRALSGSNLLMRLESLDLSGGWMTDEVAEELLAHAAALKHLRYLDLSVHNLSPEGAARVGTLCENVDVSDQEENAEEENAEEENAEEENAEDDG